MEVVEEVTGYAHGVCVSGVGVNEGVIAAEHVHEDVIGDGDTACNSSPDAGKSVGVVSGDVVEGVVCNVHTVEAGHTRIKSEHIADTIVNCIVYEGKVGDATASHINTAAAVSSEIVDDVSGEFNVAMRTGAVEDRP